VRNAAAKLTKHLVAKQQGRLDGFFKAVPKAEDKSTGKGGKDTKGAPAKRKVHKQWDSFV
jgi:flap endonuclease-1